MSSDKDDEAFGISDNSSSSENDYKDDEEYSPDKLMRARSMNRPLRLTNDPEAGVSGTSKSVPAALPDNSENTKVVQSVLLNLQFIKETIGVINIPSFKNQHAFAFLQTLDTFRIKLDEFNISLGGLDSIHAEYSSRPLETTDTFEASVLNVHIQIANFYAFIVLEYLKLLTKAKRSKETKKIVIKIRELFEKLGTDDEIAKKIHFRSLKGNDERNFCNLVPLRITNDAIIKQLKRSLKKKKKSKKLCSIKLTVDIEFYDNYFDSSKLVHLINTSDAPAIESIEKEAPSKNKKAKKAKKAKKKSKSAKKVAQKSELTSEMGQSNQPMSEKPDSVSHETESVAESMEVVSENKEVVSENKEVVSENKEVISESMEEVSESWELVSESTEVVSESTEVVSESTEVASENTEAASGSTEVVSESTEVASENTEAASGSTEVVSENTEVVSESTELVSESTEVASESTEVVSKSTEVVSESTEVVSESTAVVSEITQVVSESTEVVSETTEVVSESTEVVSESTEVVSESTKVVSESTEVVSESTEVASEGTKMVSESTKVVSESTEVVSESTEVASESTQVASESTQVASESTEVVSESTKVVSESTEVVSESTEVASEGTKMVSESTKVASESTEVASESTEVASESTEVVSESTEVASESAEVASESTEVASESTQMVSESTEVVSESTEVASESLEMKALKFSNYYSSYNLSSILFSQLSSYEMMSKYELLVDQSEDIEKNTKIETNSIMKFAHFSIMKIIIFLNTLQFDIQTFEVEYSVGAIEAYKDCLKILYHVNKFIVTMQNEYSTNKNPEFEEYFLPVSKLCQSHLLALILCQTADFIKSTEGQNNENEELTYAEFIQLVDIFGKSEEILEKLQYRNDDIYTELAKQACIVMPLSSIHSSNEDIIEYFTSISESKVGIVTNKPKITVYNLKLPSAFGPPKCNEFDYLPINMEQLIKLLELQIIIYRRNFDMNNFYKYSDDLREFCITLNAFEEFKERELKNFTLVHSFLNTIDNTLANHITRILVSQFYSFIFHILLDHYTKLHNLENKTDAKYYRRVILSLFTLLCPVYLIPEKLRFRNDEFFMRYTKSIFNIRGLTINYTSQQLCTNISRVLRESRPYLETFHKRYISIPMGLSKQVAILERKFCFTDSIFYIDIQENGTEELLHIREVASEVFQPTLS